MKRKTLFGRLEGISENYGRDGIERIVSLDEAVSLLESFARELLETRPPALPGKEAELEEELRLKFCRKLRERITKGMKDQPSILSRLKDLKPVKTGEKKKFLALEEVMEALRLLKPFLLEAHEDFVFKASEEFDVKGELENVYWHLSEEVEFTGRDIFGENLIERKTTASDVVFLLLALVGGLAFILVSLVLLVVNILLLLGWVVVCAVAAYFLLKYFRNRG